MKLTDNNQTSQLDQMQQDIERLTRQVDGLARQQPRAVSDLSAIAPTGCPVSHAAGYTYAGTGRRLTAGLLDCIVELFILLLVAFYFSKAAWLHAIPLSIVLLRAWLTSSSYQGSPGKIIMRIKVVNASGTNVSFQRALLRESFYQLLFMTKQALDMNGSQQAWDAALSTTLSYLLAAISIAGVIMIAFTKHFQGLHDKLAKTYVVNHQ